MAGQSRRDLSLPRGVDAPALLWSAIEPLPPLQGADAAARFRVELVLTELLTNILRHSGGVAPIRVRARGRNRDLRVLILSDGLAFDMSRADAGLPAELLAEGGRGLFLIRECANRLHYRYWRGCNLHRLGFALDAD